MIKRVRIQSVLFDLLLLVLGLAGLGRAQTRVDNPGRPITKNAGRVVRLDEVLRIRDDGVNAIFRSPQKLTVGPDGSLYFLDFAEGDRLYRYGPDGKLIFKILKTGQGPGESQHATHFFFAGDRIRVQAWVPPKVMDFSPDGRYLREVKVEEDTHGLWFLSAAEGKIYGVRDELFNSAAFQGAGVFSIPNSVYEISPDFKTWKKLFEFPVRMAIKSARAARLDMIDAAIHGPTLYILHTAEYRVVKFDLHAGRAERIISRAYDRVKGVSGEGEDLDPEAKGLDTSSDPYVFDITEIHAIAGNLWAFTSHSKPDGNDQQVDIFDAAGRFIDSVLLRFPEDGRNHRAARRKCLVTEDGFLILPEQEEDGFVSIGKYRIADADLFPGRPDLRPVK
ncbi:MAG: hypothetical protein OEW05_04380 [Candidatus Aminicenantes bacterium]|nr:hypothetical protein [Candidatus Aminicenantes bacterium]